jgi:uncharacterized protein involved in cysteine biosynthesis
VYSHSKVETGEKTMLKTLKKAVVLMIDAFVFIFATVTGLLAGYFSEVIVSQLPDTNHVYG